MQATNQQATVRVGHVYLDASHQLLHCLNRAARELHDEGIPLTSVDPQVQQLLTSDGEAATAADLPLLRVYREGKPVEADFVLPRGGGLSWRIAWTAAPIRDAAGRIVGVLGSVTCSPPEPNWQELAELAHDLGTPLHALRLLCAVVDRAASEAELKQAAVGMRGAAERAVHIGRQLLDICRGPAPRTPRAEAAWFPLAPFLAGIAQEQVPAAERKGLALRVELAAVQGLEILVDRIRFGRVLANLLVNAVRYTNRGRVDFTATWRDENSTRVLALSVVDTGAGISEEEKESIFHPFERGRAGKDSDSGGSGLGLAVVDRLVEELGLTLDVYSEYGRGSAFHLLVPVHLLRPAHGQTKTP